MRCKKLVLACGLGLATVANAGVMVGYLDLSASPTPNIQTSVEHGYNVVVVGWGVVNTDDTASIYPVTLSNDGGHDGLQADIARAHDAQAWSVALGSGGSGRRGRRSPPRSY